MQDSGLDLTFAGGDYIGFKLSPEEERRRRDTVISEMKFGGVKMPLDLSTAITDATLNLTIDGASTLDVTVGDGDRRLLKGPYLTNGARMAIPRSDQAGYWETFALVKVSKSGDQLTLTFEDETIWRLRKYDARIKASRDTMTRAQFAYQLCREARPVVPFISPEILDKQPIATNQRNQRLQADTLNVTQDQYGFAPNATIQVKKVNATAEQKSNIARVLAVGVKRKVSKSILIAAIMTITQESSALNLNYGDRDSVGLFQQRPSQGWKGLRDIERAAGEFYDHAIPVFKQNPSQALSKLCQAVQRSAYPDAYAKWESEARATVNAYLGTNAQGYRGDVDRVRNERYATYEFMRGDPDNPGKREDSWTCITRLANEVKWRAFSFRGTVYFISDDELMSRRPVATLSEFDAGVYGLDFDFDAGQKASDVTLTVMSERWAIPPGSVITLKDIGPANGNWLVSTVSRSLFSQLTTIQLIKPEPKLPEPAPEIRSNTRNLDTGQVTANDPFNGNYAPALPTALSASSYGYQDPEGQAPGRHGALDWFAPAGTPLSAPVGGKIFRVKADPNPAHDAAGGQVFGGSIYLQGDDRRAWVFRHVESIAVEVGDRVEKGQRIGAVKKWAGSTHVHIEAYKKGVAYDYVFSKTVDPWRLFRGENLP